LPHGLPEFSVYCASKFGVNRIMESIASELERKIKVYAFCPDSVDTDVYRSIYSDKPDLKTEHIAEKFWNLLLRIQKLHLGGELRFMLLQFLSFNI